MRKIFYIVSLLLLVFCGYGQINSYYSSVFEIKTKFHSKINNEKQIKCSSNRLINREINEDSIMLDKALRMALDTTKLKINLVNYYTEYEQKISGRLLVTTNITIGNLFSNINRHIIIRRIAPWGVYINLYIIKNNEFIPLLYREQLGMTYSGDTIIDVNGDKNKDFIVFWSPNSGCCHAEFSNVYLNKGDDSAFSKDYEFINPTFSPNEKIIRGVEYGYPEEVGLYKFKWNGFQVDTIEYIYHDQKNKGQFIKTKNSYKNPHPKDGETLKTVPEEYTNIESYYWFNGDIYPNKTE